MPAYTTCASNICYLCRTTQCFTPTGKKKCLKFELFFRCFNVLETSVTIGFSSLKILLCFNAVAENDFFFVFVFYLCQEERYVQRASSCGRRCSCSLKQTAGICLWHWCHWEPRWLCWCCLHYKLWWPAKEAEMKNIHLLAGTSCCFHVHPTSWPAEWSYLIPVDWLTSCLQSKLSGFVQKWQ